MRQPPNPPPLTVRGRRHPPGVTTAAGEGGRRGRPGITTTTTTVDAARYFWRQVDIGLTCARRLCGLPPVPKGFSNVAPLVSSPPFWDQCSSTGGSRAYPPPGRARVERGGRLRDPVPSGGSVVSIARFSFPRDIAIVLSSVFVCWRLWRLWRITIVYRYLKRGFATRSPSSRSARTTFVNVISTLLRVSQD